MAGITMTPPTEHSNTLTGSPMTHANLWQRLDDCVARELDASNRLLEALREENAALVTRNAAHIEQSVDTKSRVLAEFDAIDREREHLIRESGQATRQDFSDQIANCDPQRRNRLLDNWMQLLEMTGECQRQNSVNGALIQSGLRHTRQALSLLKGQTPSESLQYGPGGHAPHTWDRHSLGKV